MLGLEFIAQWEVTANGESCVGNQAQVHARNLAHYIIAHLSSGQSFGRVDREQALDQVLRVVANVAPGGGKSWWVMWVSRFDANFGVI